MRLTPLFLIVMIFMLAACSREALLPTAPFPDDVRTEMEETLEIIKSRDVELILANSFEDMQKIEGINSLIDEALTYLPKGEVTTELVAARTNQSDTTEAAFPIYIGTYEIANGSEYALVQIATQNNSQCCPLRNLKITEYEMSPSRHHNFSQPNKPILSYVFIAVMIFVPIFIVFTLIDCWRNKGVQRKWRWRIFILLGLYGFMLNWTTGEISPNFIDFNSGNGSFKFSLIKLNLLGAGFTRAGIFQPWILEIGLPIGALIYWWKKRRGGFQVKQTQNTSPA